MQHDVSFDVEVTPSLVEGTSLNMSFAREGTGRSMNVIAYVRQQAIQSPIASQTGAAEAEQGVDWDWKGHQDLIQILDTFSNAQAPLTFDAGRCDDIECSYPWFNDHMFENPNETATIAIVDALFAHIGEASHTFVTIEDDLDHGYVEFSSFNFSTSEKEENATIKIFRKNGMGGTCRVRIVSRDGTASSPGDYVQFVKNITIEDGSNATEFNVSLSADNIFEYPNEIFYLDITEVEITKNNRKMFLKMEQSEIPTTSVHIIDDGDAGSVGFLNPVYIFPEGGSTFTSTYQISLVRSGMIGSNIGDFAVEYATTGYSNATDYIPTSGTVHFYNNILSRTVEVYVQDDDYFEFPNEKFNVAITSIKYDAILTNAVSFSNEKTAIEIMDDGDFGRFEKYC